MAKKELLVKGKRVNAIRLLILIVILAVSATFGIIHQHTKGWRPAGVDALCPFGGIESLVTLIVSGSMLEKIALSSFILLIATVITAVLFRRAFCGTICPFGTLQELFARLGKKIFRKRFTVPVKADKILRYLKYLVFVVFMALTIILGTLAIRPYDPWATFQHLTSVELFSVFLVGFIVLIVSLLGSLLFDRFFCKYLCPMGGFLGILGRIGIFRIRRTASTCINCHACTKVCPVNIPVETLEQVKTSECINCNLCVNVCPVENTLQITGPKKSHPKRKVSSLASILIPLAIFVVVVGVTSFTGQFAWTVQTIEDRALVNGSFDADEVKGSDTFKAISETSGIPKSEFIKEFKLSETQFESATKDWAHNPDEPHDVQEVRDFVKSFQQK